jgi:hypothetical protein
MNLMELGIRKEQRREPERLILIVLFLPFFACFRHYLFRLSTASQQVKDIRIFIPMYNDRHCKYKPQNPITDT